MIRPAPVPTLLAVVTALVLAACGGGDGAAGPSRSPSPSPTPSLGKDDFVSTVVDAMVEAGSAHVALDVSADRANEIEGEGDLEVGDPNDDDQSLYSFTYTSPEIGRIEVRKVGGYLFANLGDVTKGKFVIAYLSNKSSPLVKALGSIEQASIVEQTQRLTDAVTAVRRVGPGPRLDGSATTEYAVTVDPEQFRGDLGAEARRLGSIDFHFFLDGDQRPLRLKLSLQGAQVRMDLSDWGEPVSIEAPPQEQISTDDPFAGAA